MIHLSFVNIHGCAFHITFVYGKNGERMTLWNDFKFVSRMDNSECWVAMGDFNEVFICRGSIWPGTDI